MRTHAAAGDLVPSPSATPRPSTPTVSESTNAEFGRCIHKLYLVLRATSLLETCCFVVTDK